MRLEEYDFSFVADFRHIPAKGKHVKLLSCEQERKALAERFGILGITAFEADVVLERADFDKVRMKGDFFATVEQTCGVTLEAFLQDVKEPFDLVFQEKASGKKIPEEYVFDMDDDYEPMENGKIEVGETIIELLSLSLDAFPKRRDAVFSYRDEDADEEVKNSPFSVLKTLKKE